MVLERLPWEQEAEGPNPFTLTMLIKEVIAEIVENRNKNHYMHSCAYRLHAVKIRVEDQEVDAIAKERIDIGSCACFEISIEESHGFPIVYVGDPRIVNQHV